MARNGSGTEVVPNTFTVGTAITASSHNENWADMAAEMTNSLPRDGQAGMIGQFKAASGTLALPSIAFTSAASTGIYKTASGFALVIAGVQIAEYTAAGLDVTGAVTANAITVGTPIGGGMDYWGTTAPAGWLFPYGQVVSQTTYAALYAVLSTTYNTSGEGAGNFRLPDKRNLASFGKGNMGGVDRGLITFAGSGVDGTVLGASGGAQTVAILQANFPNVNFTNSGIAATVTNGTVTTPLKSNGASSGPGANSAQGSVDGATNQVPANSGTVGVSITSQGSANSGGSGTALNKLPPGIVCNYIIYAGV